MDEDLQRHKLPEVAQMLLGRAWELFQPAAADSPPDGGWAPQLAGAATWLGSEVEAVCSWALLTSLEVVAEQQTEPWTDYAERAERAMPGAGSLLLCAAGDWLEAYDDAGGIVELGHETPEQVAGDHFLNRWWDGLPGADRRPHAPDLALVAEATAAALSTLVLELDWMTWEEVAELWTGVGADE